jgi:Fic family protein
MSRIQRLIGSPWEITLDKVWIWQQEDWTLFRWNEELVQPLLRQVRLLQGILLGKTGALDETFNSENALDTLLQNIITSSAIEGEQLNVESVRSSLAKRMGFHLKGRSSTTKRSEGLAQMMLDAIENLEAPLRLERLLQWHLCLFPEEHQSLYPIQVGALRGEDPMQLFSGRIDKPTVHFEAPPRKQLSQELGRFIQWFNESRTSATLDPLIRAALCHFWFITLHPFDDGNGRITRALTDLALAQENKQSICLYAMSASILAHRTDYYRVLEQCQRGTSDVSDWLIWFMQTLELSLLSANEKIERTLIKSRFWQHYREAELSVEQVKILNRLLDGGEKGFDEGVSASLYQKVAKVSKATSTRHLADLLNKGCIEKLPGGGRNTRYKVRFKL